MKNLSVTQIDIIADLAYKIMSDELEKSNATFVAKRPSLAQTRAIIEAYNDFKQKLI